MHAFNFFQRISQSRLLKCHGYGNFCPDTNTWKFQGSISKKGESIRFHIILQAPMGSHEHHNFPSTHLLLLFLLHRFSGICAVRQQAVGAMSFGGHLLEELFIALYGERLPSIKSECLCSYQWIPIDIFVQQVPRLGFTKGSIPLRHKWRHPNGIACLHRIPAISQSIYSLSL